MGRRALTDLPLAAFEDLAESHGAPRFAGRNLRRWVFPLRARDYESMTDLSRSFRQALAAEHPVRRTRVKSQREDAGGTIAFLLELHDGQTVETVLIPEGERVTVCVSTQVGCPVACVFCASGLLGLRRNLSPGEIIEQVLTVQERLPEGRSVSNVVVMGIGEPTLNMDALLQSLETWNSPEGLGLGARRITVSTVGYPKQMDRLAALGKEFGLAISLHAARQELRERLLPGTKGVAPAELVSAARRYHRATGRRVTFEYVLMRDENATPQHARDLANLLRGVSCIVNLIPVNAVDGLPYRRPSDQDITAFRIVLEQAGVNVTQRKTRGDGIQAACGQLRLRDLEAGTQARE